MGDPNLGCCQIVFQSDWTSSPAVGEFQLLHILTNTESESEVAQSCLTLCDPVDCSLWGSSVHGILQARILEWVAISFSNAWKWKVKVKSLSRVRLLATPWTAAYQAPPSMGFSRQYFLSHQQISVSSWLLPAVHNQRPNLHWTFSLKAVISELGVSPSLT